MFFFILIFSFSAIAQSPLHTSKEWKRLLHYKDNVSEADGKDFFIHKNGKYDPEAELKKSIEIFGSTESPDDHHPICKFPLRYRWLNEKLGFPWKAQLSGCVKYNGFLSKVDAKRASLVFSSYYLSNPNSAFGHTLLRLSRYQDKNETEMLDYGINYGAKASEKNPVLYVMKGLGGGFRGEFAALPYYYKIREYSDTEFRDLWSFDLKLSTKEVSVLVDHIWELGHTYFDYYYLKENCSYHLLTLLEVARPTLNLSDRFHFYTIPAETVRLLYKEGLIEEGRRRESKHARLLRLSDQLPAAQVEKARAIVKRPESTSSEISSLAKEEAAKVLDVALEAFDYFHYARILSEDPEARKQKFFIQRERAINPVTTDTSPKNETNISPVYGHSPLRFTLAGNYLEGEGSGARFELRPALHDLLDPSAGSLKDGELEMLKLSLEWRESQYQKRNFVLQDFSLFNVRNYQEQNQWTSPLSWELEVGLKQVRRNACVDCPGGFFMTSFGNTVKSTDNSLLLAFLLNMEANIQSQFTNNYRLGTGPKLLVRYLLSEKWVSLLESYYHLNTYEHQKIFQDYEWRNDIEVRHHFSNAASLSLKGGGLERHGKWQLFSELGLQYFYE